MIVLFSASTLSTLWCQCFGVSAKLLRSRNTKKYLYRRTTAHGRWQNVQNLQLLREKALRSQGKINKQPLDYIVSLFSTVCIFKLFMINFLCFTSMDFTVLSSSTLPNTDYDHHLILTPYSIFYDLAFFSLVRKYLEILS